MTRLTDGEILRLLREHPEKARAEIHQVFADDDAVLAAPEELKESEI
jgi:hypothetical protein